MKAFVYNKVGSHQLKEIDKPTLIEPTDAIVRILKTTICGTDLHILKGDVTTVLNGTVLGHEGVGVVEQIGTSVKNIKVGDKVVVSCISKCGSCAYCQRQMYAHCQHGGWLLGNTINGTQAEFVRTPFADNSLYPIPDNLDEEAALMLSDTLPTGFEIGVLAGKVDVGNTVAIVGAGPIGMATLVAAQFYSPAQIIMIDNDVNRLEMAKQLGATSVLSPKTQNVIKEIAKLTNNIGVDVAIECVGIEATFQTCQDIIAPGGRIANVGVHGSAVKLDLDKLWGKNITISAGLVNTNSTVMLLKSTVAGTISPEKLVTHRFKLSEIEEAYEVFSNPIKNKALKVVISN